MRKALLVGPFTGELGHEIYHWSCHIRWLARHRYPEYDVVVCSFKDRAFLYADFMTRFRPIDWPSNYCHTYSFNFKPGEEFINRRQELIELFHCRFSDDYDEVVKLVPPHQIAFRPTDDYGEDGFVRFRVSDLIFHDTRQIVSPASILLLYRQRDLWKLKLDFEVCSTNHDWEPENWVRLAELLMEDGFNVVIGGGFWTDVERDTRFPCRTLRDFSNPLEATYFAIDRCSLSISGPTGINHFQWFSDTPSFLFGCKENYNGSWRQRKHSGTNFLNTPTRTFVTDRWMTGLTAEEVHREVVAYIDQLRGEGRWNTA